MDISSIEALPKQVASIKPGTSVDVEVIREGKPKMLKIKIDPMKMEKPA
jgi:S1-C subfamily serine protease